MRNILVSHSIKQAQEPLNESGIGRLEEDNKLLVTLSQEKKWGSISWNCKDKWKDKTTMTKSQNKSDSLRKVAWNTEVDMKNSSHGFEETLKQLVTDWHRVKVKKIKRI